MAKEFRKVASYWGTEDECCSTTMVAALDPALNGELVNEQHSSISRAPKAHKSQISKDCISRHANLRSVRPSLKIPRLLKSCGISAKSS